MEPQLRTWPAEAEGAFSRPLGDPPRASAPYEARAEWSSQYVRWFVSQTPMERQAAPPDVSNDHRLQVEFSYCVLDPPRYERETREELLRRTLH